jgi:hypothetical protein
MNCHGFQTVAKAQNAFDPTRDLSDTLPGLKECNSLCAIGLMTGCAMNSDDKNRETEPAREAEQAARQQARESEEAELSSLLLRLRHKSAADVSSAIKTADTDMKSAMAYLAEVHLEQQKKTNRMLDNIQRGRIPPPLADS